MDIKRAAAEGAAVFIRDGHALAVGRAVVADEHRRRAAGDAVHGPGIACAALACDGHAVPGGERGRVYIDGHVPVKG